MIADKVLEDLDGVLEDVEAFLGRCADGLSGCLIDIPESLFEPILDEDDE